jgi:transcriptional regulator with XRE-family HTH domain
MDTARTLRRARFRAGLSQKQLADRAGTSQATVSDYERGMKEPSAATLDRLLSAAGARLRVEHGKRPVTTFNEERLTEAGETLRQVLDLASTLPFRRDPVLRYPRIPTHPERSD